MELSDKLSSLSLRNDNLKLIGQQTEAPLSCLDRWQCRIVVLEFGDFAIDVKAGPAGNGLYMSAHRAR
jgi:hypothetical protein